MLTIGVNRHDMPRLIAHSVSIEAPASLQSTHVVARKIDETG